MEPLIFHKFCVCIGTAKSNAAKIIYFTVYDLFKVSHEI